jgi:Na+/H+ antiporter NhaD/arsenite permease-like protein
VETPPLYAILPFIALLLCIALLPIVAEKFWGKLTNQAIIALVFSLPVLFFIHDSQQLLDTGLEYLSFILYLSGLFTVAGGIFLQGDLRATPRNNTLFLAAGAVLANFLGTTGASMLLIRPMLTMNQDRQLSVHIPVFFIFIVSNIGGSLTPLGDPPLFLGFLRGVPFEWTLLNLWPQWLFATLTLLCLFFIVDSLAYRKETPAALTQDQQHYQPLVIIGKRNFVFLLIILLSIILTSPLVQLYLTLGAADHAHLYANLSRDGVMLGVALCSYWLTPKAAHQGNEFNFRPLQEVAILFAGIFMTMLPALLILQAQGGSLGVSSPVAFFWLTGILSSVLDNAPTYLTFAALAQGVVGVQGDLGVLAQHPTGAPLLVAISLGAVFMGANTYIGNAPNFMVKNIAEQRGVKMPSFFGYMGYSLVILMPVFLAVTWLFL